MEKYIIKSSGMSKGDITHADQEDNGLRFSCFPISDGRVITTVSGKEAEITKWASRFGKDVSEMNVSDYNTLTKAEIKKSLELEVSELTDDLSEKQSRLDVMV